MIATNPFFVEASSSLSSLRAAFVGPTRQTRRISSPCLPVPTTQSWIRPRKMSTLDEQNNDEEEEDDDEEVEPGQMRVSEIKSELSLVSCCW